MNIGKLKSFTLVDIYKKNNEYTYTYLLYSKKIFKKLFFKFQFISRLPFYNFTDIMKVMANEGYYFEDLINKNIKISIGNLSVNFFSDSDSIKYSTDYNNWKSTHFDNAFEKQQKYNEEYDSKHGHPSNLGLYDAYNNIK